MKYYSVIDNIIIQFDKCLNSCSASKKETQHLEDDHLTSDEKKLSIQLMRINHSGEIAAQGLYQGQAYVTQDIKLGKQLKKAAHEEEEHLHWCQNRLLELGGHPSLLTPIWRIGSFGIGAMAGLMGDKFSLGFLAETEFQVSAHLDKHLKKLPSRDTKSREILLKMREDELRHATQALETGGHPLPLTIKHLMTVVSKVMTITARYI